MSYENLKLRALTARDYLIKCQTMAMFASIRDIMLVYGKEAGNRKPATDLQRHTILKQRTKDKPEKAFLKDEWSVECHYPVLNDTSIEKNRAKMYGDGERR